jgi:hypothetical protein
MMRMMMMMMKMCSWLATLSSISIAPKFNYPYLQPKKERKQESKKARNFGTQFSILPTFAIYPHKS